MSKCGHCRRKVPLGVFANVKATDGSRLIACRCGKTWVKPAPGNAPASKIAGRAPRSLPDVSNSPGMSSSSSIPQVEGEG